MTLMVFPLASTVLPSLSRTGALEIPGRSLAILWLIVSCRVSFFVRDATGVGETFITPRE